MKTFKANEFEIEFYKAMHEWVQGGKVGPDPRREWECASENTANSWVQHMVAPTFVKNNMLFRWKPAKKRTVVIGGVELVAPEVDAPSEGTMFYCFGHWGITTFTWSEGMRKDYLDYGLVFLTREDAQAMADAQRKQRIGGVL